ncbi:MAG TPA: FAD-dependent oxidoreductase [Bacteroidales bacterium]|nr:FAD-dependent oxidoreductase [Bacteroidales bacterium]
MSKKVIVIGGGITGMEAAKTLASSGLEVTLLEKEDRLGGHVRKWDRLFPNRRNSEEVLAFLEDQVKDGISVHLESRVSDIRKNGKGYAVSLENGKKFDGDALVLATGFELFNARKKEEYGFGIYDNVITSADLEEFFQKNRQPNLLEGIQVKRVGIVHCVGSRDEKAGNLYCSKVCCVTGVKQAIEIKELLPASDVFCFYMDLRMFDRHFEEMYYEAQQKWGIQFIRGRLSEAVENPDHSLLLKVEDTLTGLPLKMTVDMLILLVGFVPSAETKRLALMAGIPCGEDGFLNSLDEHLRPNVTAAEGVFIAGAVRGPVSVSGSLADARSAAIAAKEYCSRLKD